MDHYDSRIIVTGGAGFIGSHLVDKLVSMNHYVRVIDDLSSGLISNIIHHIEAKRVDFKRGDLKDKNLVLKNFEDVDIVFHYAANPEVRVSTTHPEIHFNENILVTFNVLEAMRVKDIKTIIFASSSSVYGEPEEIPVDEKAEIKPVSVYGASKAACENLIYAYSKLYGIKAVVLRYANIIGPRLRHGVIYDLLIKITRNKNTLEVLGDGMQTRSYLHVKDAVEATIIAWMKTTRDHEVYNIGNRDWITVREIVEVILDVLGLKGKTEIVYKPVLHGVGWPGDVKKIALDISKITGMGWSPTMSSREAVYDTVKALMSELRYHLTQ
ncbi:MAG: GDP-mannose 4,6-dehydratase [Desulfurococcaceae archaeon]